MPGDLEEIAREDGGPAEDPRQAPRPRGRSAVSPAFDASTPNMARVYDCLLGGCFL